MIIEHGYQEPPQSTLDRARVAIIGAVAVLATGVGVVLGSVLAAGQAAPLAQAASYVPADAVMYAEARLDLPGSQQANLRALLDRFPAADADALLTEALADTLDEALADADAPFDYSSDVAPWFDGTFAFAMLDYPLNADPDNMQLPSLVGMFGVRDATSAGGLIEKLRAEAALQGSTFTSSEHAGVTIWALEVEPEPDPFVPLQNIGFAYALADDQLLFANGAETIRSALDAAAGDSLADHDGVDALLAALPEERAGTMVMNSGAMIAALRAELESVQPGMADALAAYLDAVPPISVGSLAFAEDAVLMDGVSTLPHGPLAPANTQRNLAAYVPGDAIFFADGSRVGPALAQVVTSMKAALAVGPMGDAQLRELDGVEDALGAELDEFVSWIGDGAMAAGWDGAAPYLGLVLHADDPAAAALRLNQLGALAELAAASGEAQVAITTEVVEGVEVTRITYEDPLAAELGPFNLMALEYAIHDDTALVGIGRDFVRGALTRETGDSLAESDRYAAAVSRFGGTDNSGTFFLDITALRLAIEGAMPMSDVAYTDEVRPNLEPLDLIAGVNRVDGDRVISRLGLVLR
jgi:hypothetical protein